MSRLSFASWLLLSTAAYLGVALAADERVLAQGKAGDSKEFNVVTADGVKIRGVMYEAAKKNLGTVIMLHPIGEGKNSKAKEWKELAETLSQAGCAVAMFDFRGHGDSTTIDDSDTFWKINANRSYVKPKVKDEIDVKDYIAQGAYMPVLVNDIAAVKAYLDRKHDAKECNTANTIVIGAEGGGTLGAIWINSEWYRHKFTPPAMLGAKIVVDKRPEGNDIVAAVFLSLSPQISPKKAVTLSSVLGVPCKTHGMAAAFYYGEEDSKGGEFAKSLETKLTGKPVGKATGKQVFIGATKVPGTKLSGIKLLTKGTKTDQSIVEYLEAVLKDRSNESIERDYQGAHFIWKNPANPNLVPIPARKKNEKNLNFDTYDRFIPQN